MDQYSWTSQGTRGPREENKNTTTNTVSTKLDTEYIDVDPVLCNASLIPSFWWRKAS